MNIAHLRFTPFGESYDLLAVLDGVKKYVIADEVGAKTQKPHIHIYWETEESEKTCRNHILKHLKIPKTTRGKNSEHYCLKYNKYKDPSPEYVCKEGKVREYKGYTPEEIEQYEIQGAIRYKKYVADYNAQFAGQAILVVENKEMTQTKEKSEWNKLMCAVLDVKEHKTYTMAQYKQFIKSFYLKQNKPIPREGDSRRYAYSLYAILNEKTKMMDISELDIHETNYLT